MCAEFAGETLCPFLIKPAAARFADGVCGSPDRTAVLTAEVARNFLRRNKRLANL